MNDRQPIIATSWFTLATPAERRAIRNTARALCYSLQIPDGDHLVVLLGNGDERSNFDALQTWVRDQLMMEECAPGRANLHRLLRMLETELHSSEAASCQLI